MPSSSIVDFRSTESEEDQDARTNNDIKRVDTDNNADNLDTFVNLEGTSNQGSLLTPPQSLHDEFSDISDADSIDSGQDDFDDWNSDEDSIDRRVAATKSKPRQRSTVNAEGRRRLRPSYFYMHESQGSSRDDHLRTRVSDYRHAKLRGGEKGIPVFEPTMDEFQNEGGFYGYVRRIEKYGLRHGIVKVIPPKEWLNEQSREDIFNHLKEVQLSDAISQNVFGGHGVFQVTNIAKSTYYNPYQWWKYATSSRTMPPPLEKSHSSMEPASKRSKVSSAPSASKSEHKKPNRKPTAMTSDEANELFDNFDKLPYDAQPSDYTPAACLNLEKAFWRSLTSSSPAMYGADLRGSLFNKERTKSWNVADLGDILPKLTASEPLISGVTSPYLYFGSWRATFPWHLEDKQLYSINYVHFGAPKFWYSIPQSYRKRFERVLENMFPTERRHCPEFLRHKSFLVSPKALEAHNIHVNRVVQNPNEFIITYPHGYHAGFNLGYNCAESINFATPRWFAYGRDSNACRCIDDSVTFDVDDLLRKARHIHHNRDNTGGKTNSLNANGGHNHKANDSDITKNENPLTDNTSESLSLQRPCLLCPVDDPTLSLLHLGDEHLKGSQIHKICFNIIPELSLNENNEVIGINNIAKGRYNLKCALCKSKTGVKVQCTAGKCTISYHGSCLLRVQDSKVFLALKHKEDDASNWNILTPRTQSFPESSDLNNKCQNLTPFEHELLSNAHDKGHSYNSDLFTCVILCVKHNPIQLKLKRERDALSHLQCLSQLHDGQRIQISFRGSKYIGSLIRFDTLDKTMAIVKLGDREYSIESKCLSTIPQTSPP